MGQSLRRSEEVVMGRNDSISARVAKSEVEGCQLVTSVGRGRSRASRLATRSMAGQLFCWLQSRA
jgi:hypothetical protein